MNVVLFYNLRNRNFQHEKKEKKKEKKKKYTYISLLEDEIGKN